jgi:hypothetical protein
MQRTRTQEEEAFWQRLILPQEDRDWPLWDGIGYRWFRSSNVVALEHYKRTLKNHGSKSDGGDRAA